MNITDILEQTGTLESISRELGVDANTAQAGAAALLPAILGGFKNNAQAQPDGLGGLLGMIGGMGGGGLLESVTGQQPTPVDHGNNILGEIFGSKDVSRQVATNAAMSTGIDQGLLKKMLPILAMAVAGYMFRQRGAAPAEQGGMGGILGNVIGGMLGGGSQPSPQPSPQAAPSGGAFGNLGSMLDMDGDGNPLNDIIGAAGKLRS
jgi:hypothetical protein